MYDKILIATDGSDLATKAVDHGVALARETGGSIVFVTVSEMWSAIDMAARARNTTGNPAEAYEQIAKSSAQEILSAAKSVADRAGIKCETIHVPDRAPAEGIVETAEKSECDLIVMASHGRRGLNRMLLGSQTTKVLTYSKVPVLVLR